MKYSLPFFAIFSMLPISCRASDKFSTSKEATSCPTEISKAIKIPEGAKLIGELPESKRKLRSVGLIKKSTSHFDEQLDEWVWDEEMIEWENIQEGAVSNNDFDSTQTDWMLQCSYPGGVDPKKKRYFEIILLLPIPEHVPVSCSFLKTKSTFTASCKINRTNLKTQLNASPKAK